MSTDPNLTDAPREAAPGTALSRFHAVIGSYKTWYFALGEAGLVAAIIFHALNGLRIILVDFWKGGTQHHKTLLWIVLGLWVVLTLGFAIRHFSLALGGH